jgi:hypothetical protein
MIKAEVTKVNLGSLEIDGLMWFDDQQKIQYGTAVTQIAQTFPYFSSTKTKPTIVIKRLMGKDFSSTKLLTKLNSQPVNVITLSQTEDVVFELILKGDAVAIKLGRDLLGLSLTQRFSDAFNQHFEKVERDDYLAQRNSGKVKRRSLTDAIQDWYFRNHPEEEKVPSYIFSQPSDLLNSLLTGEKSKHWMVKFGFKKSTDLRDAFSVEQLRRVEEAERLATIYIDEDNLTPCEAIKMAVSSLRYKVWSEEKLFTQKETV